MKQELEEYLHNRYRDILDDEGKLCPIDVEDGWYNIISSVCICIQSHVDNHQAKNHLTPAEFRETVQVKIVQVKEKFGALRIYVSNEDPYTRGVIEVAETLAHKTCAACGGVADQASKWKRRCTKCRKEDAEAWASELEKRDGS